MDNMPAFYISCRLLITLVAGTLLVPLALVLSLRYMTAYGTWPSISVGSCAFFLGWYLAFFLGFFLPVRWKSTIGWNAADQKIWDTNFWVISLSCAAAVGAGLMTYNFAIVRGFGFDVQVTELRSMVIDAASAGYVGSWLGGVGRLLISAIAVAWIVACLKWRDLSAQALTLLLISTTVVFAYQAKFEGGRFFSSAILLAAFFATIGFFVSDVTRERRVNILAVRPTHVAPVAILLLMLVGVTSYSELVFVSRGARSAQSFAQLKAADAPAAKKVEQIVGVERLADDQHPLAIAYLQYAANFAIDLSSARDSQRIATSYGQAMAWIYLTQGIGEFDRIFRIENLRHSSGFYQFSQIAQVLSKLTGADMRYANNLSNYGTYITLPGALYVDFGTVLALVLAALSGICLRAGVESMFAGAATFLAILAPILFVIVATGPVTTLVTNLWPCAFWIALTQIPISTKSLGSR
ncbi:hypothetical protein [Bradyrhizobium sp. CB2312]|uniref:hypothetical protein n=1 Tax=Bradyrhizobium sp. CB2312 TaxID=3039155 RepID=UPI0024B163D1|nr:hypothetical protein [Bradyrhizobium sp. CB2312]WFU75672.1 hypothetical protein QA642_17645 [Bradyrhizobium sp. CB2312]